MTLRSFVKIKTVAVKNPLDEGFSSIGKGINNIGDTTSSIAGNFHQINELIKFEREWLSKKGRKDFKALNEENAEKKKGFKDMLAGLKKKFHAFGRKEKEKAAEKGLEDPEVKKEGNKKFAAIKGPFMKVFDWIGKILGNVLKFFIGYKALDWLSKASPEKITKTFKAIWGIAKFIGKLIGYGVTGVLNGITSLVGRDISLSPVKRKLKRFLGAVQLVAGVATLATVGALVMPWKVLGNTAMIREVFGMHSSMKAESDQDRKARIGGYRDKKTGVIYSKEEYAANMKAAKRADAARAKRAGKGMSSNLYQDSMKGRFQTQYNKRQKGPIQKLGQKNRIRLKKAFGTSQRGGGGVGKGILSKGTQKGFAVFGGITRMAAGLASGEDATQAVGAGVGQAAGGILGTVAGTALLGPFLGPFAPMVGNVIGSFLGEFIGKTFLPTIKPLFEPIGRYFQLLGGYVADVFKHAGGFELVGQIGELFGTIWTIVSPLLGGLWEFIKFVTGTSFKIIGESVGWVLRNAQRLMNPGKVAGGIVDFMTFGLTDMDGMSRAAGGPVSAPPQMAGGGLIGPQLSIMQTIGGAMLAGVVGGISMLGFAGPAALAFIGSDISRLGKLFGTGGKSGGGGGLASAMGQINTGNLKDSDTQEADAMAAIQQKLVEVAGRFNKMVMKMTEIFAKDAETESENDTNLEGRAGGGAVKDHNRRAKQFDPTIIPKILAKDPKNDWQKFSAGGEFKNGYMPPEALTSIGYGHYLAHSVAPQFKAMIAAAEADGHKLGANKWAQSLWMNSSYRSFQRQKELYDSPKYDAAYPGTSNHGLGRAVDFGYTDAGYRWLRANAHKFGFTQLKGYGIGDDPDGHEAWHFENLTGKGTTVARKSTPQSTSGGSTTYKVGGITYDTATGRPVTESGGLLLDKENKTQQLKGSTAAPTSTVQAKNIDRAVKKKQENDKVLTAMVNKAAKDKDRDDFIAPGFGFVKKITQRVINNSGGSTTVAYTRPSQLLSQLC